MTLRGTICALGKQIGVGKEAGTNASLHKDFPDSLPKIVCDGVDALHNLTLFQKKNILLSNISLIHSSN
jgi:RIO-like serine/threonine protein kinase